MLAAVPGVRFVRKLTLACSPLLPLPEFVGRLSDVGYTGDDQPACDNIVSLHSEYKGSASFRKLTTPELLNQSAEDLRYLKGLFERFG